MIIDSRGNVAFDHEVRDLTVARTWRTRVRSEDTDGESLGRLTVNFTKFDTWYEVNSWWEGRFLERTVRGAFTKTIAERGPSGAGQIVALFDHGHDLMVGDKPLALVDDIYEDAAGAVLTGLLFDTSYNRDLAPGLRAGVYRSSFMFNIIKEEWKREVEPADHNPEALPERTITEVRLFEAGPVTFPANPAATAELNSACRSDTDRLYKELERTAPESVSRLRRRIMDLRTSGAEDAGHTTSTTSDAARDTDEPAGDGHSGVALRTQRQRRIREAVLASR